MEPKASGDYDRLSTSSETPSGGLSPAKQRLWCSKVWRGINFIMALFFLLAAFVQINDPDPFIWVPVYVIPALYALAVGVHPPVVIAVWWRYLVVVHMALCLAGTLYLSSVVVELLLKDMTNPLIHEEGREVAGLIIILAWLGISRFGTIGNPEPSRGSMNALLLVTAILGLLPLVFWGLCFVDPLTNNLAHCSEMFKGGLLSAAV